MDPVSFESRAVVTPLLYTMISTATGSWARLCVQGMSLKTAVLMLFGALPAFAQEQIRSHQEELSGTRFGAVVTPVGDIVSSALGSGLDGYDDYVISSPSGSGEVRLYSGQTGLLVTSWSGFPNAGFGNAVCSLGDVNGDGRGDIAIASWMGELGPLNQDVGYVSIYSGMDGSSLLDGLANPELQGDDVGDRFGSAMVSLGSINGESWFAVSAVDDDDRGSSSGSVRILSIAGDLSITRQGDILGWSAGDRFGASLAACDLNNGATPELIVGAPLADASGGLDAGRVYLYEFDNGSILELMSSLSGEAAGDHFGCSVAGLSSWGSSAMGVVVVGADSTDVGGAASGAVYVFSASNAEKLISWDGATAGDNMGAAVVNAGDTDRDGFDDILFGVPGSDSYGVNAGEARLYSGADGSPLLTLAPEAMDGTSPPAHFFGRFGSSVAGLGRIDYDGPLTGDYYSDFAAGTDGGATTAYGQVRIATQHLNEAPVPVDDAVSTLEDQAVQFTALTNDVDADGFIDQGSVVIVDEPVGGYVLVEPITGEFTYTPLPDWAGVDSFTYSVADEVGAMSGTATVTVTVQEVNDAPVAVADSFSTDEDTPVLVSPAANDTDVDGVAVASTLELISGASNGSVSLVKAGVVQYSPVADWFGADSFTYRVQDDDGEWSNVAECMVTVLDVNDAPVAVADAQDGYQDWGLNVDVLANDYDIDGSLDSVTLTITGMPSNGAAWVDSALGGISYLGDPGFVGTDTITYTVRDDDGGVSNGAVLTLTILEDCNGNQSWDVIDISSGTSPDCNQSGVPDECELDGNDCDMNGVPDECDPDCDANGRPDVCDLLETANADCDSNGVLDVCQVDCNENGLPDNCDILFGVSRDCDQDGLPDECASIRWVDGAAADCNGDGSWGAPFCTLQQAINSSTNGDVLMALPGVYDERIDFAGRNISLKSAVNTGSGTTIIDGGGSGPVVRFQNNESRNARLEGFTVRNGHASGGQAGGIAIAGASPTIQGCRVAGNDSSDFGGGASTRNNSHPLFRDCVFEGNHADDFGGAMILDGGSAELNRCRFVANTSGDSGGALYGRNGANGVLTRCVFAGNEALSGDGGGAFLDGVSLDLVDCEFTGNQCTDLGGGLFLRNASALSRLQDCRITGNTAGTHGGGVASDSADVDIRDCLMRGNVAGERGGGLYVVNATHLQLEGNEYSFNTAGSYGGGMYLASQNGSITRCTSSGNVAGISGGGAYLLEYSNPKLDSCVFWGDSPDEVRVEISPAPGSNGLTKYAYPDAVRYSCIQGGWPIGDGNIASDPMFRDPLGDFGLMPSSPCVDTGNPSLASDPDGSRADMGAEPYQGADIVDVLTWNFGGAEGLESLLAANDPVSLMTAATNYWSERRDHGATQRLGRLADLIHEESADLVCVQGLTIAHSSPVGDVLSGAATSPSEFIFDDVTALMDRLAFLGSSYQLVAERSDYDLEVPVMTCAGYADVRLQGQMITLSKGGAVAAASGDFSQQLTGPLGGLGPVSLNLGYQAVQPVAGPLLVQTRLEGAAAVSLQGAQASELGSSLQGASVIVGDFASSPGSAAYNAFLGLGFDDAHLIAGAGGGETCCQSFASPNTNSTLSERLDWCLENDPTWTFKSSRVVGTRAADRTMRGRWTSAHAGLLARYVTP